MHSRSGQIQVDDRRWLWAETADIGEMWTNAGDLLDPNEVARAARFVQAEMSSDLIEPRVRLMPSTYAVVGEALDPSELMDQYDEVLKEALRRLGISGAEAQCDYGMPSEYRGWLAWARERASQFVHRTGNETVSRVMSDLAEELVMGTCAVALSMRESHVVTPYITAVALCGLRSKVQGTGPRRG